MFKTKRINLIVVGLFLFLSTQAQAALSPISLAIIPPVQFPPSDFSVTGLRTSLLWGHHRDVYGFDFGVVGNMTQQRFLGLGVSGVFNYTRGMTTILGLQAAGIANINVQQTSVYGVQIALGLNSNTANAKVVGLQLALGNYSPFTNIYGLQAGIYNKALEVYGFQIGLINSAKSLHGIQIGLLNFNETGLFAVAPFLNIGF